MKTKAELKFSALIPTYNRRAHVFRAIESILGQSIPVEEIVVVDDGSTDGTCLAIQEKYGSKVRVVTQKNGGVGEARRRAVEEAKGEWVAFLDSDDEWTPGRNEMLFAVAASAPPQVAWIFGDTQFVTDAGCTDSVFAQIQFAVPQAVQIFRDPLAELPWDQEITRPPVIQSSVIRRASLIEMQCFQEGLRHGEDLLAGIQIASRFWFAAIPQVVTRLYRTGELKTSSLELTGISSIAVCKAGMLAYELAARTSGKNEWIDLYADRVRRLCKASARERLPIRRLAGQQFRFGISLKSLLFWCAAMLGGGFFRAGFFFKGLLRRLSGKNRGDQSPITVQR